MTPTHFTAQYFLSRDSHRVVSLCPTSPAFQLFPPEKEKKRKKRRTLENVKQKQSWC